MSDQGIPRANVQNKGDWKRRKKAEKQAKPRKVLDGRTELYRHYDEFGRLLYVGVSLSSVIRLWQHRENCEWSHLISTITIERYATRRDALEAEKTAIKKEQPYFNRVHSGLWRMRRWEHPYKPYVDAVGEMVAKAMAGTHTPGAN